MKKSFRENLRFNSLFVRTFLSLAALTVLISLVFYGLVSRFMYRNIRSGMQEAFQRTAGYEISHIDQKVENIQQRMLQLANESSVVNAAITPGILDKNHNARNIEILSLLRNLQQYNSGIDSVILYESGGDELYTSSGIISKKRESGLQQELDRILDGKGLHYTERNRFWNVSLRRVGDSLYLCMEFLYSVREPLSRLIVKLDTAELFSSMDHDPGWDYLVSDTDGVLIRVSGAPDAAEQMIAAADFSAAGPAWDGDFYFCRSDYLDWQYIFRYDFGFAELSLTQNLFSMLPVLGIMLLISFLASVVISVSISRPIKSIVENILMQDQTTTERLQSSKNEMDFLAREYNYSAEKESHMQNVLREISGEALERTLIGVIEENADEEEVRKIIEHTGSGFRMDSKYCMILAREAENSAPGLGELSGFEEVLRKTAEDALREKDAVLAVLHLNGDLIFLAGFAKEVSSQTIRSRMNNLYKKMLRVSENRPFSVRMAVSFVYSGIQSLPLAYRDLSAAVSARAESEESLIKQEGISFDQARTKKISLLEKNLKEGDLKNAETVFRTLMTEIREYGGNEEKRAAYGAVIRIFAGEESSNRILTDPPGLGESCLAALESGEYDKLQALADTYGTQILKELDSVNKRRKNRYVAAAKEYIGKNYQNSSLSLTDAAEALNLNKSYLSTLMNDVLSAGFTDYLNGVRIGKAKELLENTDLTVSEICAQTGFNSDQNFIRVFKKYVGMTPGQYRKTVLR